MNWRYLRMAPWLDRRAQFAASLPAGAHLLDLGSGEGGTLGHIHELRPDLRLTAVDIAGEPTKYPAGCAFHRVDLEKQAVPLPDGSVDAITCMHVVEHLASPGHLFAEIRRLLRSGGRSYVETPHPRSLTALDMPPVRGDLVTTNFYDDTTHARVVTPARLVQLYGASGLAAEGAGVSRNWLLAASYAWFRWGGPSRYRQIAYAHYIGWSVYVTARKP